MKPKKDTEANARAMADAFMQSQPIVVELNEIIGNYAVTPATMAFAFSILESGIAAQVDSWRELRKVTDITLREMQEHGMAPTFRPDGSVDKSKMSHP